MKKISKKQLFKKFDRCCYFCGESDYNLLDSHRIKEGNKGGKYERHNCVTACALCHRKIHAGNIKIIGRHYSTTGKYILHYIDEEGEEKWK